LRKEEKIIIKEVSEMSIQYILDKEALDYLPKIKELLNKADDFSRNQMREFTIRSMMNSIKPVANMNKEELEKFELGLIETFEYWENR